MRRLTLALALLVPTTAQALPLVNYGAPVQFKVGDQIEIQPGVTTTGAATFTVAPALPSGLAIDGATGRVTGSPTVSSAAADYVVSVADSTGTITANLRLAIAPRASALGYQPVVIASIGAPLTVIPDRVATGPTSFTVAPALPVGLTIDAATGTISGQPVVARPAADYVISMTDSNGTVTSTVRLVVGAPGIVTSSDGVPVRTPEPDATVTLVGSPLLPVFPAAKSGRVLTARAVLPAIVHAAFSPRSHIVARLAPSTPVRRYQVLAATSLGTTLRYKIALPGKKTGWVDARLVRLATIPRNR